MSTVTATESTPFDVPTKTTWRLLALAGAVVGLLGLVAIAFPFATGIAITYGVGAVLLLAGVVHGAHAFTVRGWSGRLWQLAMGVVGVVAGAIVLANPLVGLASLTILLIAYFLVDGVAELWLSRRLESGAGRASVGLSGAISLVLAGMLFVGFPANAAWALGLLVGVSLLATGLATMIVAYDGRRSEASMPTAGDPGRA